MVDVWTRGWGCWKKEYKGAPMSETHLLLVLQKTYLDTSQSFLKDANLEYHRREQNCLMRNTVYFLYF